MEEREIILEQMLKVLKDIETNTCDKEFMPNTVNLRMANAPAASTVANTRKKTRKAGRINRSKRNLFWTFLLLSVTVTMLHLFSHSFTRALTSIELEVEGG